MSFIEGEYIPLIWDGKPDAYYIKGHVSHEDGIKILFEGGIIDDETEVGQAQHIYARWSTQGDAPQNVTQVLREYNKPGRGRFKVTMFGIGIFANPEGRMIWKYGKI